MKSNDERALIYLALQVLCSNNKDNTLVPDILYILDPSHLYDFIRVFGGEKVKVPTAKEFMLSIKAAISIYYLEAEGKDWDFIVEECELKGQDINSVRHKINAWRKDYGSSETEFLKSMKG